jgi:putative ATP-binding cassette transporter
MTLYGLIQKDDRRALYKILASAAIAGMGVIGVLLLIGVGAQLTSRLSVRFLLLFVLTAAVFARSYAYCANAVTELIENVLWSTRVRLAGKIRNVDLLSLERIGPGNLYEQINLQTSTISGSAFSIALGLQALFMLIIICIYLVYLSKDAFYILLVMVAIATPWYARRNQQLATFVLAASKKRVALYNNLTDFLRGFKEVQLRVQRGADLYADYATNANRFKGLAVKSHVQEQESAYFIELNMYILLAAIVFVLPQIKSLSSESLSDLTITVMFLLDPVLIIGFTLVEYQRAELAAESIQSLEERLDAAVTPVDARFSGDETPSVPFSFIQAQDLYFEHKDPQGDKSFSLGPLSLSLRAGEIVFFVGGNGSGKTTLLKLLTGLYPPTAGSILVDGMLVNGSNRQAYRELYAAIFTDFHLFKKLYGLKESTAEQVQELLIQMQMHKRVRYEGEGEQAEFSNLELSTGQRKRLAMVVALLEDRPIYVLDEWAADQDPEFRRYYYEELLPELKQRGKTVLAISHDDRYYHCADRVVIMEYGAIRSIESHRHSKKVLC